jgi:hypothetical protein
VKDERQIAAARGAIWRAAGAMRVGSYRVAREGGALPRWVEWRYDEIKPGALERSGGRCVRGRPHLWLRPPWCSENEVQKALLGWGPVVREAQAASASRFTS